MIEKIKTGVWFLQRPGFWPHMAALTLRKFDGSAVHEQRAPDAAAWAKERAVSVEQALRDVGALAPEQELAPPLNEALFDDAQGRAAQSGVKMGGPGDLDLIYQAILAISARRVVETGVAYGWSSLAALAALRQTDGKLASVDMPYPKANNEAFVGIVVPQAWRDRWSLIRRPDRNGIHEALQRFDSEIDLAHFDSDKTYAGRMFAFPLLWKALRSGGLLLSDDIQDNFGFRDYSESLGLTPAVVESGGKFVGILRKSAF